MTAAENLYDVVIVGGGPAGLTGALYLARARYRVLVLEKEKFGGQITITETVVNYPGLAVTSGAALSETMRKQAESFGAEFRLARVTGLDLEGDIKVVHTDRGDVRGLGVLLATGANPRKVGFQGEEDYQGRGVAYCATCDGEFFTGRDVYVIGGGYAAAEESVFLTKYARHVTVLIRGDGFKCAPAVAEPALQHKNITVLPHTEVVSAAGDNVVQRLTYRNNRTGEETTVQAEDGGPIGVFVFAGCVPETALLQGLIELDRDGYVVTDRVQKTSRDGVYAAGDVCIKPLRQVVTAVSDGALAATELERWAAAMQKKTGLHPVQPARGANPERAALSSAGSAGQGRSSAANPAAASSRPSSGGPFTDDMKTQIKALFDRLATPLLFEVYYDDRPLSVELDTYLDALCALTDKLTKREGTADVQDRPCVRILRADGTWTGLAFHGVPGGHEFTSFLLGLYNAAGPGQPLSPEDARAIGQLPPHKLDILVSLTCTICPDLVTAVQHVAALNDGITAEVYDIAHYPAWKDKYHVLGVPCLVVDDGQQVHFGKKSLPDLVKMLQMPAGTKAREN